MKVISDKQLIVQEIVANQKMKKFGKWLINNVKFSIREDATDKYIFYGGHSDEIYTMDEIVDIYKRELLKIKHKGNL